MITVGITGGIGSGKSTVAKTWKELGAHVVFADDLAKEMMHSDSSLRQQLSETFGKDTYTPDGALNKSHLINEAFRKNRIEELNAIVHPAIQRKIQELILSARKTGTDLFAYEAAILLNKGRPDYLDVVVLVTGDKEIRLKRVAERDKASEQDVLDRMAKQPDFTQLTHHADYLIDNNGTIDDLKQKASNLYKKLIGNH